MRSNFYSIDSIYQFEDSSVEYSKEFPLGEGNFGVVYKGERIFKILFNGGWAILETLCSIIDWFINEESQKFLGKYLTVRVYVLKIR